MATCPTAFAQAEENYPDRKPVMVQNCPYIKITDFQFSNQYSSGSFRMNEDAKWQNIGTQPITAFEFVILKYDAFNTRMVGDRWVVTGTNSGDWKPLPAGASSGDGLRLLSTDQSLTEILYVNRVRLVDGTIWNADYLKLNEELAKMLPDIKDFGGVKPDPNPTKARP